jgi:hypothetical protein
MAMLAPADATFALGGAAGDRRHVAFGRIGSRDKRLTPHPAHADQGKY